MRDTKTKIHAFTLIEIMVVMAIIAILAAILIPNYMRSRGQARLSACKENLHLIATAVQVCLVDHPEIIESSTAPINVDEECVLLDKNYLKAVPICPSTGQGYEVTYYKDGNGYFIVSHLPGGDTHADVGINPPYPRYNSNGGVMEDGRGDDDQSGEPHE